MKRGLDKGFSRDNIKKHLIQTGWDKNEIDEIFNFLDKNKSLSGEQNNEKSLPKIDLSEKTVENLRPINENKIKSHHPVFHINFIKKSFSILFIILIITATIVLAINVGPKLIDIIKDNLPKIKISSSKTNINTQEVLRNEDCFLKSHGKSISILENINANISVSGYKTSEEYVVWEIRDSNIATISPTRGASTKLTPLKAGTTQLIATDLEGGKNCKVTIDIEVKQNQHLNNE